MSEFSPIEWCDATWNMLLGCSKCSAGCKNCYAIRTAWRLQHNPNAKIAARYAGLVEKRSDGSLNWTGKINLCPDMLALPLSWKDPKKIFVNSQSDLFHPDVPFEFVDKVFAVMAACPQHTFQILTKRPERMAEYLNLAEREDIVATAGENLAGEQGWCHAHEGEVWPLPNVWLEVSVEDQPAADSRIHWLLRTPAAVRFLSMEPLLRPVDLTRVKRTLRGDSYEITSCLEGDDGFGLNAPREKINWVIVGGESGPGARPMDIAWVRSLIGQCKAAGVPCLIKQLGARPATRKDFGPEYGADFLALEDDPAHPDFYIHHPRDKKGGNMAEWPADLRVREFPTPATLQPV